MWPNSQEIADLVTFTEEILIGKLHFLCSVSLPKSGVGKLETLTFYVIPLGLINDITFYNLFTLVQKIGCFADMDSSVRPFPESQDIRPDIDWFNIEKTVDQCANITALKSYEVVIYITAIVLIFPLSGLVRNYRCLWKIVDISLNQLKSV